MQRHHFKFTTMGSPCELQFYAEEKSHAVQVSEQVIKEMRRLNDKYTRYDPASMTSRINASAGSREGMEVDTETAALFDYAAVGYQESGGLFDITSGILRKAWDFKSGKLPEEKRIKELLPLIGWDKVEWRKPKFTLPLKGMEIDFGGIVKEYAADAAATICYQNNIRYGFIELGGDIRVIGPHPDGRAWSIGIADPRTPEKSISSIALTKGAIASSGDYERFMEVDGKRYCHILNPKTGWPVEGFRSVSVVSEQCVIAGTASTIAMLKGAEEGREWLEALGLPYLCCDGMGKLVGSYAEKILCESEG